jgi:hypothetical protein
MKRSTVAIFVLGIICGVVASLGFRDLPRRFQAHASQVPLWARDKAVQEGAFPFRDSIRILDAQDVGQMIEDCQTDFVGTDRGAMRLLSIYQKAGGETVTLVFDCYRDTQGNDVSDRVIAYIYSRKTRTLIGKFWVPMA